MSDLEKERRKRTDTLSSGGLVTKALKRLSAATEDSDAMVSEAFLFFLLSPRYWTGPFAGLDCGLICRVQAWRISACYF